MHPVNKLLRALVVLIALAATGPAMAEMEFYAGLGVGASDADAKPGSIQSSLNSQGYDVTGVTVDGEDSGWRFLTGLRFGEYWAVELGWIDLGEVGTQVNANVAPSQTAQFNQAVADALPVMPKGLTLAGVARFTMAQLGGSGDAAEKLNFAVKLGVIDADSERTAGGSRGSDQVDADPYYGIAVGWDFNEMWRGVVGYEVFNMADSTTYWSAGLEFKFPSQQ